MTGDRHNSNTELVAQGFANVTAPGRRHPRHRAIARTATTPALAPNACGRYGLMPVDLLLIILLAAPLAKFIPLATLAAVLFGYAHNMGEWRETR